MGDFFRSWKRKLGVLTLLVACAGVAIWVRASVVQADHSIPIGQGRYLLVHFTKQEFGSEGRSDTRCCQTKMLFYIRIPSTFDFPMRLSSSP